MQNESVGKDANLPFENNKKRVGNTDNTEWACFLNYHFWRVKICYYDVICKKTM